MKIKLRQKIKVKNAKVVLITFLTLLLAALSIAGGFGVYFWDKIYPNVRVNNIDLSGKTLDEATQVIEKNSTPIQEIVLTDENSYQYKISLAALNFRYDYYKSAERAYKQYRTEIFGLDIINRFRSLYTPKNLDLLFDIDEKLLSEHLSIMAGEISIEPVYPTLDLSQSTVNVNKGKKGQEVKKETIKEKIYENISQNKNSHIKIEIDEIDPTITDKQAQELKERAQKYIDKEIILKDGEEEIARLIDQEIVAFLAYNPQINELSVEKYLAKMKKALNKEPQNAVFTIKDGKVEEFLPAKDGLVIKEEEFKKRLSKMVLDLEKADKTLEMQVPLIKTAPKITTEQVNDLGIEELLGRGDSKFAGSIASRIHNISLAARKFDGVLVAPGKTFSFNNILGDVSRYTGYKQAYVIRDGKTVLGDGGGVCQVSTTLFRAALSAGLPIVERRAHSYRVGYYEQGSPVGLDATVYAPTTDLKIKNDTPGHILIQTLFDARSATLAFEIYGTSDRRVSTVTTPIIKSQTPPPEDLYIDDPTLPEGETKQIDYKAWGANVVFDYFVKRDGETIYKKTFYSNYKPWQAKFLRGTGPSN